MVPDAPIRRLDLEAAANSGAGVGGGFLLPSTNRRKVHEPAGDLEMRNQALEELLRSPWEDDDF